MANPSEMNLEMAHLKKNIDDVFLLTNGIIVCLMQCGFACLEVGSVRSKNVTNIIMKNLLDIFISALCYWLIGYSLAYSAGNAFLGYSHWAGVGVTGDHIAHWFFQFVFAATAATIVSGAVAERCNFVAYIVYSGFISGFMYPIVSHWVWTEQGWLAVMGYKDFAGSGAVHLLAGTCSLVAAALLGPRIGRFQTTKRFQFEKEYEPELAGHSTPLVGLGGMILIAGFLAFNGGSLGRMTHPGDGTIIAQVMCNTVMGGCGGSLIILAGSKVGLCGRVRAWSFANTLNATFAGMVSVCAAADNMTFWTSFVSGVVAGILYMLIHNFIIWSKVDDPLDTVAVHFGGGLWGLISASIFANDGLVFGITNTSTMALVHRLAGAAAIIAWSGALSLVMFGGLKWLGLLRVTLEQEMQGMDVAMHDEPGYPARGWHPQPSIVMPSVPSYTPEKSPDINESAMERNARSKFRQLSEFDNMAYEDEATHARK